MEELGIYLLNNLGELTKNSVKELIEKTRSEEMPCYPVFPHEWNERSEQIKKHIMSYTKIKNRVYARNCICKEIDLSESNKFCEINHIQGANKSAIISWGIFNKNELAGILSLGRHHRQNVEKDVLLLNRLCFKFDTQVIGGASKLFSKAKQWSENKARKIISFSDNRWSSGDIYEKLGFSFEKELPPDYFYVDKNNYLKYYSKQSQKKQNTGCPKDITELEWATQNGLLRVYDAGKKRWAFELSASMLTGKVEKSKTKIFWCEFCKEEHSILNKTYKRNVNRNARYICTFEYGHINGTRNKKT